MSLPRTDDLGGIEFEHEPRKKSEETAPREPLVPAPMRAEREREDSARGDRPTGDHRSMPSEGQTRPINGEPTSDGGLTPDIARRGQSAESGDPDVEGGSRRAS